jgi:hypothetical protein
MSWTKRDTPRMKPHPETTATYAKPPFKTVFEWVKRCSVWFFDS